VIFCPGYANGFLLAGVVQTIPNTNFDEEFHPKIKGGADDEIDCIAKCVEAADCFEDFSNSYKEDTWSYPAIAGENCQTFQKQGMRKCNLGK
jgi:hypothetical protein